MKPDQQAILARDIIDMIRDNADTPDILECIGGIAFSLARIFEEDSVVSWNDIANICDQRYYSLQQNNPVKLDVKMLDKYYQLVANYIKNDQSMSIVSDLDYAVIEKYYEKTILPQYNLLLSDITWREHAKIGIDTFAHYFNASGVCYVLVFEDFPSQPNFIAQDNEFIAAPNQKGGIIHNEASDKDGKYIENKTGYFSLFKEV